VPDDAILVHREILVCDGVIIGYDNPIRQLWCPTCKFGACMHNFGGAILVPHRAILMSAK
jgi:hypothetical protein